MSCFPCFYSKKNAPKEESYDAPVVVYTRSSELPPKAGNSKSPKSPAESSPAKKETANNIASQTFTFRELAAATKNFRPEYLLGEGGFGRVYKGVFEKTGQVVAVKQLDRNGLQGNKEFLVEVLMLSLLHHPNLVNLIGYCADGDQRLLVYEFMPRGSLEDHLLDLSPDQKPLSWYARMKIASAAAQGLEYLHDKANPPVIYRDLKPSNILLDEDFNPKLSDFGLAKLGPVGENHVSSRVMGTYGYCAPEYARTGHLTSKSDVYSFGVVLLELISGRRAIDTTKPIHEQNLVSWAQPMFSDQKRYSELVDPLLLGDYPTKGLNQAVAIAAMCLQEEASVRPLIADVVVALSFLSIEPSQTASTAPTHSPVPSQPLSPEPNSLVQEKVVEVEEKHSSDNESKHSKQDSEDHSSVDGDSDDDGDDEHHHSENNEENTHGHTDDYHDQHE